MIVEVEHLDPVEIDELRERVEAEGGRTRLSADRRRLLALGVGPSAFDNGRPLVTREVATSHKLSAFPRGGVTRPVRWGFGVEVGGRRLAVIAGPCSVEGRSMFAETAFSVRAAGAVALRGGAFKPRTSPYAFQGLEDEALEILAETRARLCMPVVTEVLDPRQVELVAEHADVLQIGARSMQNFPLLSAVGDLGRPVLLKRGLCATIEEWLLAAEYIMARGNEDVVLCERGLRTYLNQTRNTLDIAAIPLVRSQTHLPVVVDPSHAAGRADLVGPLARAAVAAGADGLMVEVHPRPGEALSDGDQSLEPGAFRCLMRDLRPLAELRAGTVGRRDGTTSHG